MKFAAGELAPSLGSSGSGTPWSSQQGCWGHERAVPAGWGDKPGVLSCLCSWHVKSIDVEF